jgi:hypothetical protein
MAAYPLINGNRCSWSSIELNVNNTIVRATKAIDYTQGLEPGKMRGTHAQKGGRTRGEYEPEASITFFLEEYYELIGVLGNGYMEASWDTTVSYSEKNNISPKTDKIIGCRFKKNQKSHAPGPDALIVKCDLDVMFIFENGISPIANPLGVTP